MIRYFYFAPDSKFATGGKRNFLNQVASGDIIIHADNDDIAMARYVEAVVELFIDAATNATFDVDYFLTDDKGRNMAQATPSGGAPNITTRCCRSAPGRGPLLRDMINQVARSCL